MNEIKRRLSTDEAIDEETKVLRRSIACFEDFSNELFYEIFEYIEGFDLYGAFSNLNIRFTELLECAPFLLKFHVPFQTPSNFQRVYDNVIVPNKHRIISFSSLLTRNPLAVFSSLNIDSSFDHLESLVLWERRGYNILPMLHRFTALPRLSSLRIYVNCDISDDYDPYLVILSLPVLTYIQISVKKDQPLFYTWVYTAYPSSSLQYLKMDHPCLSLQLIDLLSSTPQLRHLYCRNLSRSVEIIYDDVKIKLLHLTHFSISHCEALFDEFEILIKQIGSQLQVLRLETSDNLEYLNAHRWEQLFVEYLPNLRTFELKYHINSGVTEFAIDDVSIVEFTSAFWIERQWVCEFNIQIDDWEDKFITFSIHSYRKKWHQFNDFDKSSFNPVHFSPSVVLNRAGLDIDWNQFSIDSIISVFIQMRIAHLIIDCPNIYRNSLIKLLRSLPHLCTLKLYSLSPSNEEDLGGITTIDTITKVNLGRINELHNVEFLLNLFPQMEYLEFDCSNEIDMKLLVRSILKRITRISSQLRTICLHRQNSGQEMIKQLEDMIHHEKLLQHYTITCIDQRICIQLE